MPREPAPDASSLVPARHGRISQAKLMCSGCGFRVEEDGQIHWR